MNYSSLTRFSYGIKEAVPESLALRQRWLLWTAEPNGEGKKPKKIPRYARTMKMRNGKLGSETDLSELVTLEEALNCQAKNHHAGIGYAIVAGDGIVGIDLDNCIDIETGEITQRAMAIVMAAGSYCEISPSGTGLHIIVSGEAQSAKCTQVEVYSGDRFFCFTGSKFGETSEISSPSPAFFEKLHRSIEKIKEDDRASRSEKAKAATAYSNPITRGNSKDDFEVAENALSFIAASVGNDEWVNVGMALKAKFGDNGLDLWDRWSATAPDKYPGRREIESRWRSFRRDGVNFGSLVHMAQTYGMPSLKKEPAERKERATDGAVNAREKEVARVSRSTPQTEEKNQIEPIDIFGRMKPPALNYEHLPDAIMDYVADHSALIGTDPSVIALGVLVGAAACIHDGIKIQPKRNDKTWKESARIWGAVVGDPSTRKSPGFGRAIKHVKRMSLRMADENAVRIAEYKREHDVWASIKDKSARGPEPKEPAQERLYVEDTTVEALSQVLKDNPRGVLCFNDELSGWFASMDAYKGSAGGASKDKSHWLEAYNGGSRLIDRVTRGSIVIPNWSACVLGGIQPDVMRRIGSNLSNDGLLQRFMVVCPGKAIDDEDREADEPTINAFEELFETLLALQPAECGAVTLSDEAHESRLRVRKLADGMMAAFESPHIKAWLGKWTGLFARLLLLYHCIECAEKGLHPMDRQASGENAHRVERFMCDYLLHHTVHFYRDIMDANDTMEYSRQIGRLILSDGFQEITRRDLMRRWKAFRKLEPWEVQKTIESLVHSGWLIPDESDVSPDGRPRRWFVNEAVHRKFSKLGDEERARRTKDREMLIQKFAQERSADDEY